MAAESHPNVANSLPDNDKEVKAPNLLERAKEEFEAIAHVLHQKKESPPNDRDETQRAKCKYKQQISHPSSEKDAKAPNLFVRAKEEVKAIIHHDKSPHHHHRETHGRSDDIGENTPISEVKGPNAFERIKEEFEAVFHEIHPKKER